MTRDLQMPKTDERSYPLKPEQPEIIEKVNLKETEVKMINRDRFKRYKKNLQRRARNIL
jgi:hypothetical protein